MTMTLMTRKTCSAWWPQWDLKKTRWRPSISSQTAIATRTMTQWRPFSKGSGIWHVGHPLGKSVVTLHRQLVVMLQISQWQHLITWMWSILVVEPAGPMWIEFVIIIDRKQSKTETTKVKGLETREHFSLANGHAMTLAWNQGHC